MPPVTFLYLYACLLSKPVVTTSTEPGFHTYILNDRAIMEMFSREDLQQIGVV
jgi:hypothetical protein